MQQLLANLYKLPIIKSQIADVANALTARRAELLARRKVAVTEGVARHAELKASYADASRRRQQLWRDYEEAVTEEMRAAYAVDSDRYAQEREVEAIDRELRLTATTTGDNGDTLDATAIAAALGRDLRNLAAVRQEAIPHRKLIESADAIEALPVQFAEVDRVLSEIKAARKRWLPEAAA